MEYLASVVGISGAGKSTAIANVVKILTQEGLTHASFHDRTGDPESVKIEPLIQNTAMSVEARLYLILAARRQVIDGQILPSMRVHDVTLTDRYYPCTIAYQAGGQEMDEGYVSSLAIGAAHDAIPRRIFLLDIPTALAKARMLRRDETPHLFDDNAQSFHGRVRRNYLAQAVRDQRFHVIDATGNKQEVARDMANVILYDLNT